jgi:large subunit ribosomal protein L22
MEAKASAKYQRGSAQKARLVVDLIRGKNVAQALAILQFTSKRAAGLISKCVQSAIANANHQAERANIAIDPEDLWVKACFVDQGPTKRRFRVRPAPQGRAYRERRHYCHISVVVSSDKPVEVEVKEEQKKKAAKAKTAEKPVKKAAPKKEKVAKAAAPPEEKPVAEQIEAPVEVAPAEKVKVEEPKAEEVVAETVEAKAEAVAPEVAEAAEAVGGDAADKEVKEK